MLKKLVTVIRNLFTGTSLAGYDQAIDTRTNVGRPAGAGADYSLEQQEHRLRILEKARHLERNNALATAMLDRIVELVVGTGIRPQARTSSKEWNKEAERLLEEWAERPEVRNLYDLWEAQRLMVRGCERDGDIFAIKLRSGQFQLIEADRIHTPLGLEYAPNHVAGIDLDHLGRPLKYYVVPRTPIEHYIVRPYDYPERITVNAKHVLSLARRTRPSQTRGMSMFATNLSWFEHLDKFAEATVISARMAACLGLLIESPLPMTPTFSTTNIAGGNSPRFDFEPGMVKTLMPGEKPYTLKPEQPSAQYGEFLKSTIQQIGLPAGLPLEILAFDFKNSSYSAARAAFMLAFRAARLRQSLLISSILRPLYKWKIRNFINKGLLADHPEAMKHDWIPPGFGWIDPTKEVEAAMLALDAGLTTRTRLLTELGMDFEELVETTAREAAILEAAGVSFSNSNKTRDAALAQETPQ